MLGNAEGTLQYFQNDGNGNFTEQTGADNPFDGVDVGSNSTPTLGEVNHDVTSI